MRFEILTDDETDRAQWRALIDRLPPAARDIHFLPEYGAVYRLTYGHQPFLAVLEDGPRCVVQPFVKRPLNDLPFLKEQGIAEPYYDIASPYGYGGPVLCSDAALDGEALLVEFTRRLLEHCRDEAYASEFASLHPFLDGWRVLERSGLIALEQRKEVVYMDLTGTDAERWKAVRKGHKSSIGRARKSGVRIERVAPTAANFDELNRLYYHTMERNGASARWLFPKDYFANCHASLEEERVSMFFAYVGEATASASILIHDYDTAYYHFSGSDERFNEFCPNNLLVFEAAGWAGARGYRRFHLGGGVTASPQDSLFVFKSGFSDRRAPLHTYHRVLHQPTYDRLCALKRQHELATDLAPAEPDFFPFYRR